MIEILSPNTGQAIGHWQPESPARIEAVLAGLGPASRAILDRAARRQLLASIADRIEARRSEIAQIIVAEVGKTPGEASDEVDYALTFLRHALVQTASAPDPEGTAERRLRVVPAGPALAITPYNDPLAGIVRKIAPAIAAGCPVVVKPSALGQLTAQALFSAAGDTQGAVTMVNHDDRAVLRRLIADPRFRVLSFTGSTETGLAIASSTGLKRLVLELGGNNPFLVVEGADIAQAAADAVARKTRAAGQACSAMNRIYVVASLFQAFRTAFLDRLSAVTVGPSDAGVVMGPVRSARDVERLNGLAKGGAGFGKVMGQAPCAFRPTVLDHDAPLRHAEAFGPLVSLCPVPDRKAALAFAAAEDQALVCYIYGDVTGAELAPLRFGSLGINSTRIQGADAPTGGFGLAGIGREGGLWGLREYQTTINERWG